MEVWKQVPGFKDYEVSSRGRVRRGEPMMRFCDNGIGYLIIRLREGGTRKRFYVHRLVLNTFRPQTNPFLEVNHIDHNKKNNWLDNLEWVTHRENLKKAVSFLGKQVFCQKHH